MTDLRELARPHIDAAARFTPELADLQRRATALRRRRRIFTSLGLFGAVGVCVAVMLVATSQPTRLVTAGEGPARDHPALSIQRVEARGGPNGTSEVTVVFNAPLPIDGVATTDSVESVDPDSFVAAIQDPGPGAVEVCGTKHWFPEVPEGSGSVDLLIPAAWLVGDPPVLPAVTPLEPAPDKIVICGPYRGHVQVSIWGAAPTPTETLDVTISDDRTRIIVRVATSENADCDPGGDTDEPCSDHEPTALTTDQIRSAEAEVRAFLADLSRGDLDAAQDRLSDYAFDPAADLAKDPILSRLAQAEEVVVTVTPSWSFTEPGPIVTASTGLDTDAGVVAAAFLVDSRQPLGFAGGPIHRVQTVAETPKIDTTVASGEQIVIPGVPVEGGGRAFLGDAEVPLEVDYDALEMRVTYPPDTSVRVLTISLATPELPTATAFVLDVTG